MSIHVDAAVLTIAQVIAEQRASLHDIPYEGWNRASIELKRHCLIAATAAIESVRPYPNTSPKVIARITPSEPWGRPAA